MGLERDNRAIPYIVGRMIAITERYAKDLFCDNTIPNMISHPAHYIGAFSKYVDKADEYYKELADIALPGTLRKEFEKSQAWVGYYHQKSEYSKQISRQNLGESIKRLRAMRGMSQRALAEKAGITAANVANIENGKYSVGYDVLTRIATALDAKVWVIENEMTVAAG